MKKRFKTIILEAQGEPDSDIEFRNQFIVSAIKFEKKPFEVYDTDNPVNEVLQLNIYFNHMTTHSSKPYKL